MFREIINSIPFWWFLCLTISSFILLSYVSSRISSYYLKSAVSHNHRVIANNLVNILSGGFSILLAFVIITTWNYRLQTSAAVAKEADYLSLMIRDSEVFPVEIIQHFKQGIQNYTIAARADEWSRMRQGSESVRAWIALEALFTTIQSYKPQNSFETIYYTQMVNNLNSLVIARRERLNQLVSIIPKELREAIIAGCVTLVIILGAIRGESSIMNNLTPILFSAILGFNLALALSFDFPFSGDISVSNQVFYQGVLGRFQDH